MLPALPLLLSGEPKAIYQSLPNAVKTNWKNLVTEMGQKMLIPGADNFSEHSAQHSLTDDNLSTHNDTRASEVSPSEHSTLSAQHPHHPSPSLISIDSQFTAEHYSYTRANSTKAIFK
uniref:Uncharacterized protein n=1 Tax=Ditylenchus dipsaci TaxID=166011 RepID=A0A915CZN2_9BILA